MRINLGFPKINRFSIRMGLIKTFHRRKTDFQEEKNAYIGINWKI
jgi:hypothetical protein